MNQRTYLGTNLLDISKGAVENFMKVNGDGIAIQQMSVPQTSIKSISFCLLILDTSKGLGHFVSDSGTGHKQQQMGQIHVVDVRRSASKY